MAGDCIGSAVFSTVLVKTIGDDRFVLGIVWNSSVNTDSIFASDGLNVISSPIDIDSVVDDSVISMFVRSSEPVVILNEDSMLVSANCGMSEVVDESSAVGLPVLIVGKAVVVSSFAAAIVCAEVGGTGDIP